MGRQKTKGEWITWFKKYESGNFIWDEYFQTIGFTGKNKSRFNRAKIRFRKKYRDYISYGDTIIMSMSGKKSTGRPRKEKDINWDEFTREELIEIARRYKEITKDKKKSEKDKEASSLNLSKTKISLILGISRSGLYYAKKNISKRDKDVEEVIINAFVKNKGIFGRDRIAAITGLNYRRVGRYMSAMNLECKIRKAKRSSEMKNTNVKYSDLVKRDYNGKNIIATDVSYIRTSQGFSYLSIAIDHHTKKILSWNFSKYNDIQLVCNHFKEMNLRNKIVHSDHGSQYSSIEFQKLSKHKGFDISMSRVGNSLDNREAEYFFSNIKSECLSHLPNKYTHEQINDEISKYISWYNTSRPQSILKWKTPEQFAQVSI